MTGQRAIASRFSLRRDEEKSKVYCGSTRVNLDQILVLVSFIYGTLRRTRRRISAAEFEPRHVHVHCGLRNQLQDANADVNPYYPDAEEHRGSCWRDLCLLLFGPFNLHRIFLHSPNTINISMGGKCWRHGTIVAGRCCYRAC